MNDLESLQAQREEIEQYDDESVIAMIEHLIEGDCKREALIEAYLILWKGCK